MREKETYISFREFAAIPRGDRYDGSTSSKRKLLDKLEVNDYYGINLVDPDDLIIGDTKDVVYFLRADIPKLETHLAGFFGLYALTEKEKVERFLWSASPNARITNSGCPFLTGKAVWLGFNDLESRYPEIAKQWHPAKNCGVLPSQVSYASNKEFFWLYPYDDPITGRHFDFVWKAKVENRTLLGEECPFLAPSPKVWMGFNDLATCYPEIAAEFHPTKNRKQTPDGIYKSSSRKYWWKCSKCGKVWRASAKERIDQGAMCSQCRKQVNYCT